MILMTIVPISIFWLVPQYFIVGAAEFFTAVGQLEFFWLLAILSLVNFAVYLLIAKWYAYNQTTDDEIELV